MQAIGPAHQAQNHRNCRKTENGSQLFQPALRLGFANHSQVGAWRTKSQGHRPADELAHNLKYLFTSLEDQSGGPSCVFE
jgi:hypothetical protein